MPYISNTAINLSSFDDPEAILKIKDLFSFLFNSVY